MGLPARSTRATSRKPRADRSAARLLAVATLAGVVAGCATAHPRPAARVASPSASAPLLQPGRPGEETLAIDVRAAVDLARVGVTPADVRFMQGMIGHHAQAVDMVELLKTRTRREDMKLLAARIDASQRDEIAMMREWLEARGQPVPDAHAHHADHPGGGSAEPPAGSPAERPAEGVMPGMLTTAQMAALASATATTFDRLFLSGMIQHHEGALTMVQELFAAPGAAQDSEMFAFASDVDADQRMEISRMRALLNELEKESTR